MEHFWTAARSMLHHRRALAGAIAAAVLSAAGLGAGLLAVAPILDAMVGDGRTLADLANDFNAASPVDIPPEVISLLPTKPYRAVLLTVIVICVLTVLGATANFFHLYLSMMVVERTIARTRRRLFAAVVRLPLRLVVAGGASDPVSRVVNDPQQLGAGLAALISKGVAQVTKGAAGLIVALIVDWRLTLVTLTVTPVLYTLIRRLGKKIRRASRAALEGQSDLYAAASESVQGLRVVRVHGAERYEIGRFHRINKRVLAQTLHMRLMRAVASPAVEAVSVISVGLLALIATKAVLDGQMNAQDMILVLASLGLAGASLKPLTGILNDIQQSSAAAERIHRLLDEPAEPDAARATGSGRPAAALPDRTAGGRAIAFDRVTFTYPGADAPALRGVSLEAVPGETLALVGPNGSGKTTLLSLVPRLFDPDPPAGDDPAAGRVLLDGVDLRGLPLRRLRREMAVVTQETVLFAGTAARNIAYGRPGATREQIAEAAERARATEFIAAMGGLDAPIGERGLTLSGGQRQRIAIARAILRDPAILLLDEATSMIDAESEAKIGEALAEFARERTVLVVAHRLSTVLAADRIAVLDRGRLVDSGGHAELLERCGVYRGIAERQLIPAAV